MKLRESLDYLIFGPKAADAPVRAESTAIEVRGDYDKNRLPEVAIVGRTANWSVIDNERLRLDAVRKCVTVWACATILADAVAEADLTVEEFIDDEWTDSEDIVAEMVQRLIWRPNPHMEDAEFVSLIGMQQAIQGYAVVEKTRRRDGLVVELWPLRPDWLVRNQYGDEAPTFKYVVPGKPPRPIPAEDLIFLPYRQDDLMTRYGVSPVMVAAREIGSDGNLTDFLLTFLQSGGVPPYALITDEFIEDNSTIDRIQTDWKQKYGGRAAAESIPVLHSGMRLEKVGDGIGEMAWPDLRGLTELKICQAFRVPPGLVGAREALISGPLTSTESDGDMRVLQRHGAEPLRQRTAAALGRALLPEFGLMPDRFRLVFDTAGIKSLQEDTDTVVTRYVKLWDASLVTQNQALAAVGLPELGDKGDVYKVGFASLFVSASGGLAGTTEDGANSDPTPIPPKSIRSVRELPHYRALALGAGAPLRLPSPPVELVKRDVERMEPEQLELRASAAGRIHRDRSKLIDIGSRQMRKFFKAQGARIASAFEKGDVDFAVKSESDIYWSDETKKLIDVLMKFYAANGEAAFKAASDIVGTTVGWDVNNPRILSLLDQLGERIVRISERTRRDVIREITAGTQEGNSISQIADRIRGLFEETYKSRAEAIARTETQVAYNRSSVLAYNESGEIDDVELMDNPDHDEEYGAADGLTCAERDGLVVSVLSVDLHIMGEHPNGSLIVIPLLRTPLGDD